MAEISIGRAVGAGFGLIRRRPLSVLAWGLIHSLLLAAVLAIVWRTVTPNFAAILAAARSGQKPPAADPAAIMQMQSVIYLFDFVSLFVSATIYCAIFRAVLRPEDNRFAYLRLGLTELTFGLTTFGIAIGAGFAIVLGAIPLGIVVAILVVVHAKIAAVIVGIIGGVALAIGLAYVLLRLCLLGPMMVDQGTFRPDDAWRLTKGKIMSLFGMGVVLILTLFAVEVVWAVVMMIAMAALGTATGAFAAMRGHLQQPAQIFNLLWPILAVGGLLWIPFVGPAFAIMGAPWASAYRDLKGRDDLAETFG